MSTPETPPKSSAAERVDLRLMNSKIAADNALMSWMNITISLISFGFAIYEILRQRQQAGESLSALSAVHAPQYVGLFLIVLGTVGILMGIASYLSRIRRLRVLWHYGFAQPTLIMAVLISALGLFLIISIVPLMF